MSTHRYMDKICIAAMILALVMTFTLSNGAKFGIQAASNKLKYENTLFDTTKVHEINITMENWDQFIASAANKKYASCAIEIDGEKLNNVGIRAKGSSSVDTVRDSKGSRYSFKIEFDHYEKGIKYQDLDKLNLNNVIFDSTYMMDYLTYEMMRKMGVASPLCSYVNVLVNGKPWGLYLAVEGLEESFLERNYGSDYGRLYNADDGDDVNGGEDDEALEDENWDESMAEDEVADVNLCYIDDNPESYSTFLNQKKVTKQDKEEFISFVKKLSKGEDIEEIIDVDKVIRYFVVHNFVVNDDSYTGEAHNYFLYEKDGQFTMLPWDYNLAFGLYDKEHAKDVINAPINEVVKNRPLQNFIFQNESYTKMYHRYYKEFIGSSNILNKIKETNALIAPYVKQDVSKFCTYEEYQKAVQTLTRICELRLKSIAGQLDGTKPSTLNEQKTNPSKLIDDSSIELSNMLNTMEGLD